MKILNKKGFSLVELIVVIALMGILAGLLITGIGVTAGLKAKAMTEEVYSYLESTKTNTLAFDGVSMKLYKQADGFYVESKKNGETLVKKVGDKALDVKVALLGAPEVLYDISSYNVEIGFSRTSGGFNKSNVYVTGADEADYIKDYIDSIKITQGSRSYTIKCVRLTGKFYIE